MILKPGGIPPVRVWELLGQNHTFRGTEGLKTKADDINMFKQYILTLCKKRSCDIFNPIVHVLFWDLRFLLWEWTVNYIMQGLAFLSLTLYFFLSDCISFFENVFLSSVLSITLCKALYFLWIVVHFREREKQLHLKSDIWAVSPSMHLQWTLLNIDEHWIELMNIDDFSMMFSQASYDSEVRRFESIIRPAEQRITL